MKHTFAAKVVATLTLMTTLMSVISCGALNESPFRTRAAQAPAAAVVSSLEMTGIWTVIGHHIPGISAMSDADAKTWLGRTVRLTARQAISPVGNCDDPAYTTEPVIKDRFLGTEFDLPPGSLTPLASLNDFTVLQVFCGRKRWTSFGGRMIQIDKDRSLVFWNGVFFELARDRDFRAVGQEPFWRLQIEKGKELRFTYALGKQNASTPAPVPQIDRASGTNVYHAVTEANELRVVIKPTQCLDVMSGRPFEKTVTVTHNGQIYQGCGEAFEFK